jgi:ribosome biogenesis GTPase
MVALVLKGSRNIFTVRPIVAAGQDKKSDFINTIECRIKGKVLKGVEGYYNILAPGDKVEIEQDNVRPGKGLILSLIKRKNAFARLNQKGVSGKRNSGTRQAEAPQLLAANLDLVLCVTTPASPPWRPRFLDRLLLQADIAGIPAVIVFNKCDLEEALDDEALDIDERLEDFRALGYPVYRVSAKTGEGLAGTEALPKLLSGKRSLLTGQSGVGKSSLINALLPGLKVTGKQQRTGSLNEKYERGNHVTTQSVLLEGAAPGNISLIDSPGIRRLLPWGVNADDLLLYWREFAPLAGKCSYGMSCTHTVEPGCKILEAVEAGFIHEDRYESFLRLREELGGR